ncbi:MAG: FAD:protein FMN transferase, partial [Treponema sp.]|nr:FAD:protein FMN transferase [Treponema sp.]
LGTVCSVNAFEDGTEKLYGRIAGRLEEIDDSFSVNKEQSSISRINRAAGKKRVIVGSDVFFVIRSDLDFAERSWGAFDPTIGPLVALWRISSDHPRVPSRDEIAAVLTLVDWHKLSLNESDTSVFLEKEGMTLDLGGIAKGYAADEIVRILREQKVKRAIIDLGGNIYVFGMKADGSAWKVGVKNPADEGATVASVLTLQGNMSVVTSGNYERYFVSGGQRYHHIIDPKTGYPCENSVASVTIVSPSSMEADAMSTSAFLMGAEAFSQTFPKASFLFIFSDGHCVVSDKLAQSVK